MMLDRILELDKMLFVLINSHWTAAWADQFFPFITDLHKTLFFKVVLVPLILVLFIWRRGLKKGLLIFFFCLISVLSADGIGNHGFKKTIQRPRPGDTAGLTVQARSPYGGYSFVSNHAANNFGFATFIALMFPPARWLVFTIATLVCYSRIYNGVHFPADVLGGALIGILCGWFFSVLCKKLLNRMDQKEQKKQAVSL